MADCKNLLAHFADGKVLVINNNNSLPSFLPFIPLVSTVASGLPELCPASSIFLFKCKVFHLIIIIPLGKNKANLYRLLILKISCDTLAKTDTCLKYSLVMIFLNGILICLNLANKWAHLLSSRSICTTSGL